ncbi:MULTISPECIES: hypothetical protein [Sphingobacterium]|uniref:Uncharacterized protein n=1 Tax=Sphingobacterium populi TaxID=1812824 RepID=A0ABW5UCF4_9SPHI|nr:hypothetical protein [Sphingobacterium sp. CFCC 11742]
MLPTILRVVLLVEFELNKDFIVTTQCINKAKPKLRCDGQCFLAKQLEKTAEPENKKTESTKFEKLEQVFSNPQNDELDYPFRSSFVVYKRSIEELKNRHQSGFLDNIFRPPLQVLA